ncbi:glucose 1-dehydrogenase [Novosphingobium sp. PASSN1]|uniref:glucose 1-dehydrogenase n=1 Tax=Novosphingobium sp. PASSN1 TaxID=2015561 RepID=UPI000BC6D7F6|nr:glucose 1-dehydrogenase [Novosphingobium sp. PASSN1]OYU35718.1 MAG: 3-alpha-hydroxysteroid dehydrogenase [Novosphingobium sp. PASSN1]
MSERLAGKVALISGAAQGIGAAIAAAFVAEGAKVVLGDIAADELTALAAKLGPDAVAVPLDVTEPAAWEQAVALAVERFGSLSVLVNNAGIAHRLTPIDAIKPRTWDRVLAVNLTGPFNGIQAATSALRQAGKGAIINVSSIAGIQAAEGIAAYAASKFGVRGLTKVAAFDLGRDGIRVNSIHPGLIDTRMAVGSDYPVDGLALPRMGLPEEVAQMAVFLASNESSYCSGGEFVVDGGDTAGRFLGR